MSPSMEIKSRWRLILISSPLSILHLSPPYTLPFTSLIIFRGAHITLNFYVFFTGEEIFQRSFVMFKIISSIFAYISRNSYKVRTLNKALNSNIISLFYFLIFSKMLPNVLTWGTFFGLLKKTIWQSKKENDFPNPFGILLLK